MPMVPSMRAHLFSQNLKGKAPISMQMEHYTWDNSIMAHVKAMGSIGLPMGKCCLATG